MPQDNFGRVLPPPEQFNALPTAMKAECLALMAERAREMGIRRRLDMIESRMCLYAKAAPYQLTVAQPLPVPTSISGDSVWNMSTYDYHETRKINEVARGIVAAYWPHCDAHALKPRPVRMLAFIAETQNDRLDPVFAYDLAVAFNVGEPQILYAIAQCEREGFLVRRDEHSWLVTSPADPIANRAREA